MNILPYLALLSLSILKKSYNFLDAVLSGFWLGVLGEKGSDRLSDLHYEKTSTYNNDIYNLTGLQGWEYDRIKRYFSKARNFLIIGAGGGRETAALRKWGAEVDSYECSEKLVDYGNGFLKRNKIDAVIKMLPKNSVPEIKKKYHGIIIGWGAYSHIQGRKNRIALLSALHPFCSEEANIMISFLVNDGPARKDKITRNVSNFFRLFSGANKTETGDRLLSYYAHFFTREEIEGELKEAGFSMIDYYDAEYGCVIGTPGNHPE